jgi:hypothetical protein
MDKKNIWKKVPAIAIIGILIVINATGSAGIINNENICAEEKQNDIQMQTNNDPTYILYGTMVNGWFISCVTIQFNWNPDLVKEIWINIAAGGWQRYTNPVETCEDGRVTVNWYWIDIDDVQHGPTTFLINIDKTPPTVTITREILSDTQMKFTANVADTGGSGVVKVEWYEDDEFRDYQTEGPYEYTWTGSGIHIIKAKAFDLTGHTASAEADTERKGRSNNYKAIFLSKPLQDLLNILIWSQKIFLQLIL